MSVKTQIAFAFMFLHKAFFSFGEVGFSLIFFFSSIIMALLALVEWLTEDETLDEN